jgi:hypothetical protein
MTNHAPQYKHLIDTQWKPGVSGNPSGKPKGTKHLSTWIKELMDDEDFEFTLADGSKHYGTPIKAIVTVLIRRAVEGDMRAFDLLGKYGYGTKVELTQQELPVPILGGLSQNVSKTD